MTITKTLAVLSCLAAAAIVAGCGSRQQLRRATIPTVTPGPAVIPHGRPQAVEPVAGGVNPSPVGAPGAGQNLQAVATPGGRPSGPASVTASPSTGAPTDAEVKAAIAKFQLAVGRYHLNQLDFSQYLLDPSQLPPGVFYTSIASVFTDYGLPIACSSGVLHPPDLGVANKTLPCGTMVTFVYGGRAIRIPVIDRGPYIAGREWDLTGAAAEALHFPGLGPIQWRLG